MQWQLLLPAQVASCMALSSSPAQASTCVALNRIHLDLSCSAHVPLTCTVAHVAAWLDLLLGLLECRTVADSGGSHASIAICSADRCLSSARHLTSCSCCSGTIAFGINRDTAQTHRASGWGPLFLDSGSGHDLGEDSTDSVLSFSVFCVTYGYLQQQRLRASSMEPSLLLPGCSHCVLQHLPRFDDDPTHAQGCELCRLLLVLLMGGAQPQP